MSLPEESFAQKQGATQRLRDATDSTTTDPRAATDLRAATTPTSSVPILELIRSRPDHQTPKPPLSRVALGVLAWLLVAGLMLVPFEVLWVLAPEARYALGLAAFLVVPLGSIKLSGHLLDRFDEKFFLQITEDAVHVVSSKRGDVRSLRYTQVDKLIIFDDEWYGGSHLLRWYGLILDGRGELPLELQLGDETERVARICSERTGLVPSRERIVWPPAPEED